MATNAGDAGRRFAVPIPPMPPATNTIYSGGAVPANTYVVYSNGTTLTGDSGFTRASLALTVDSGSDGTYTFGTLKAGLVPSGTAGIAYLGHSSAFTTGGHGLRFLSTGQTCLNTATGTSMLFQVNGGSKFTVATSSANFATGVPLTINDSTASSSTSTGALIVTGGIGVAAASFTAAITASGNLTSSGRIAANGSTTTYAAGGSVMLVRAGGTIGTAGDMVLQTDTTSGPHDFVFAAGLTTAATVAKITGTGGVSLTNTDASTTPAVVATSTCTIAGAVTDGYSGAARQVPTYTAGTAQTVTRHNYIDLNNVALAGAGPAALTDACVMRFDAAAGTHKAVDSGTTKTSPGAVTQWIKVNVNGTLAYIPSYSSKTT